MTLTLATDSILIPLINKQFAFMIPHKQTDDRQQFCYPPFLLLIVKAFVNTLQQSVMGLNECTLDTVKNTVPLTV